jgi:uncharacterized membrane protein YgcG
MPVAAEYPLLNIFWTMTIFVFWVIWIWILVSVLTDVFRRRDLSGWGKAGWSLFVIVLPYLGVFVYLITQHDGMTERALELNEARSARFGGGGGAAGEIANAKQLLDSGAIDQTEFQALKAKALA